MFKVRKLIGVLLLTLLLLLSAGCSEGSPGEVNENDTNYHSDDDNAPRTFVFADQYPYPGKKAECTILDKTPNVPHTVYIYVINNGENWKDNDVRNITITYYDLTRPGVTVAINSSQIHILKDGKKDDQTYIRVDNVVYPQNARGYFLIQGEIEQGNNKWYQKSVSSNQYNYGTPPPVQPPLKKENLIYEKEIVQ
ncbi:MAG: hypothetical protein GX434_06370 [Peptococcaceae bacterium]|nr:hypothetical protein [Peptococcaceae bacterium]